MLIIWALMVNVDMYDGCLFSNFIFFIFSSVSELFKFCDDTLQLRNLDIFIDILFCFVWNSSYPNWGVCGVWCVVE